MNNKLANLDTLRAFAVTSVLVGHIFMMAAIRAGAAGSPLIELGHVGVLAFFVHTSLVLMFSLERLARQPGRLWRRFYVCRAFRIYPLAILSVLIMLLFRFPPDPWDPYIAPRLSVIFANLALLQNFVGKTSILGPLWSLPFEVDMYLVLPALFWLARRRNGLWLILATILSFSVVGWMLLRFTGHANIFAYVPCFVSGVLAYSLSRKIHARIPAALWPVELLVWFGLTAWARQSYGTSSTWLMCLILGCSIYGFSDSPNRVWNTVTSTVAKYSYGIYLLHMPALLLVFSVWKVQSFLLGAVMWLILTLVASAATFHLLEDPFIQVGKRVSSWLLRDRCPAKALVP